MKTVFFIHFSSSENERIPWSCDVLLMIFQICDASNEIVWNISNPRRIEFGWRNHEQSLIIAPFSCLSQSKRPIQILKIATQSPDQQNAIFNFQLSAPPRMPNQKPIFPKVLQHNSIIRLRKCIQTKSKKSLGNGFLSKIDQFFSNKRNNRELFVIYDTRKWRMVRETRAFGVLCVNTVYLFSNRFVFFLFLSNKKLIQGEKSKMATIDRDSLCVQEWNGIDYSTNTKRTS